MQAVSLLRSIIDLISAPPTLTEAATVRRLFHLEKAEGSECILVLSSASASFTVSFLAGTGRLNGIGERALLLPDGREQY